MYLRVVTPHNQCIRDLCAVHQGLRTRRFRKTVEACVGAPKSLAWFRLRPDAFEVAHRYVHVIEVEDTSRLTPDKLFAYAKLWAFLEREEWEFELTVMDIRGGTWKPNLAHVYYEVVGAGQVGSWDHSDH